ncbi:MAG: CsgG/HfaB family protein [Opitutales bacterium]|jgi:curli biogenesis system outer membrane secretion channel CsgG
MKIRNILYISLLTLACLANVSQAQRKVLAVGKVKTSESVNAAANRDGSANSLMRVSEAIDGQLIDALNGTRKFEIIARSDLDALLEEGAFTGAGLQVGGSDYLLVPSIDDYQDLIERATFGGIGATAEKRKIRLGMVCRIYDAASGKLVESTNFQLDNKNVEKLLENSTRNGSFSDDLLRKIAEEMGGQIANRVVDVIYPARVMSVVGPQVTINRGDGTGIAVGQKWDIFALGEEMIDPDTGESLGQNEVKVGEITINRVTPKFSTGNIGENFGIVQGAVARPTN